MLEPRRGVTPAAPAPAPSRVVQSLPSAEWYTSRLSQPVSTAAASSLVCIAAVGCLPAGALTRRGAGCLAPLLLRERGERGGGVQGFMQPLLHREPGPPLTCGGSAGLEGLRAGGPRERELSQRDHPPRPPPAV